MKTIFNIIIILAATALTQWHGILFWSEFVGQVTGWAWSITLELSALWLWLSGGRRRALAFIASCLLLSGPLFHIVQPVLNEAQAIEIAAANRNAQARLINEEIRSLETALNVSLLNSKARTGWLNDIQDNKRALNTARNNLAALYKAPATSGTQWALIKSLMQSLALLVIWSVSVFAITDLSKPHAQAVSKRRNAPAKQAPQPETGTITAIVSALDTELNTLCISQSEWADRNGFSKKHVSLVRNHEKRKTENKETAPPAIIKAMAEALQLEQLEPGTA